MFSYIWNVHKLAPVDVSWIHLRTALVGIYRSSLCSLAGLLRKRRLWMDFCEILVDGRHRYTKQPINIQMSSRGNFVRNSCYRCYTTLTFTRWRCCKSLTIVGATGTDGTAAAVTTTAKFFAVAFFEAHDVRVVSIFFSSLWMIVKESENELFGGPLLASTFYLLVFAVRRRCKENSSVF